MSTNEVNELFQPLIRREMSLHELKLMYVYQTIKACEGNKAKATRVLGLSPNYLYTLAKKYEWKEFLTRGRV